MITHILIVNIPCAIIIVLESDFENLHGIDIN